MRKQSVAETHTKFHPSASTITCRKKSIIKFHFSCLRSLVTNFLDVATDFRIYLSCLEDWRANIPENWSIAYTICPVIQMSLRSDQCPRRQVYVIRYRTVIQSVHQESTFSSAEELEKSSQIIGLRFCKIQCCVDIALSGNHEPLDEIIWFEKRQHFWLIRQFVKSFQRYTRWFTLEVTPETWVLYRHWQD